MPCGAAIAPVLQSAINATGIVLHTGLGRARLAPSAVSAITEVAANHCNLEIDRDTGKRGSRREAVRNLLCELTGAEDAAVVNNCAGAVFLSIAALAAGREVLISRGELVGDWRASFGCRTSFGPAAPFWWRSAPRTGRACAITAMRLRNEPA